MRPPPNSAELFRIRRAGRIPASGPYGHVSVLPEWGLEVAGAHVIAPPDIDPRELDFSFVAGLDVCVFCRIGTLGRPVDSWLDDVLLAVLTGDPASVAVVNLERAHLGIGPARVGVFIRRPDVE